MKLTLNLTLTLLLLTTAANAADPLEGFSDRKMTIELRQVKLAKFMQIVGEVAKTEVQVDDCAGGRELTLKFKNAPVKLVLESVGEQLKLSYAFDGKLLKVGCREAK